MHQNSVPVPNYDEVNSLLNEPDEVDLADEAMEARIRRSLGMGPSTTAGYSSHTRRRFVRDGEVPVVILNPKRESENRHTAALADLAKQLAFERSARERAERALIDAQATIQMLQTRVAHAEIDRAERAVPAMAIGAEPTVPAKAGSTTVAKRHGAKRARTQVREPQPIKWWTTVRRTRTKP